MIIARKVVYWLFVCCLPALLITSTIRWEINELRLYEYGFNKYEVSRDTGIGSPELQKVARHLVDYFNLRTDTAQVIVGKGNEEFSLFNERELIHLRDVRDLVQRVYLVQIISLSLIAVIVFILAFMFRTKWRVFVNAISWGGVLTLCIAVSLALWALLDFQRLFILFHLVSFPNEYWILDPARDYLIRLFPEGFFYDAALLGFAAVSLKCVFMSGVGFGVLRLKVKKGRKAIGWH